MSLWGEPEGIPCCCLSGCCEGFVLPDCITLDLESSCCPGDMATVILTKEDLSGGAGGAGSTVSFVAVGTMGVIPFIPIGPSSEDESGCPGGERRPFNAATNFCGATPSIVYTGALPADWCPGAELGNATVLVFCCIDPLTGEQSWWIYIGDNDLSHTWYPASTAQYYRLTLISCDPFLLQFGSEPDCSGTNCVFTWQAVCFVEGTLIDTPRGKVSIEVLQNGDEVIDIHGETVTVKNIVAGEVDVLIELTDEHGIKTGVTPEHPFFTDSKLTIDAAKLVPGQNLPGGKTLTSVKAFRGKFKVFNLSVSGSNTFIADGYFVHNKGNS
ncbi:MAG: hypothetical protein E6R03_08090 [Hyphomicrobiaceae bacterium]|nr:MAG: hypothetical protein E6R03_08090 [Hyphomicrobiaceae bacterium]